MDIDILQGRAELFTVGPIVNEAGGAQDLTNTKMLFVVKQDETDTDAQAVIVYGLVVDGTGTPTTSDGISFGRYVNGVLQDNTVNSGYVTIEINDDDTRTLGAGSYKYELALVEGTRPYTLRSGTLTITDTLIENPETLMP